MRALEIQRRLKNVPQLNVPVILNIYNNSHNEKVCYFKTQFIHSQLFLGIDSTWQPWGEWSQCTASCGKGVQIRARACSEPAFGGNEKCPGNSTATKDCKTSECPGNPFQGILIF